MIIQDMRTLNAMAKRGLIKLDRATGETVKHWTGIPVKAYYISDYGDKANRKWSDDDGCSAFEYKGKRYTVEYFDGCFCPFVMQAGSKKPAFA